MLQTQENERTRIAVHAKAKQPPIHCNRALNGRGEFCVPGHTTRKRARSDNRVAVRSPKKRHKPPVPRKVDDNVRAAGDVRLGANRVSMPKANAPDRNSRTLGRVDEFREPLAEHRRGVCLRGDDRLVGVCPLIDKKETAATRRRSTLTSAEKRRRTRNTRSAISLVYRSVRGSSRSATASEKTSAA